MLTRDNPVNDSEVGGEMGNALGLDRLLVRTHRISRDMREPHQASEVSSACHASSLIPISVRVATSSSAPIMRPKITSCASPCQISPQCRQRATGW